MKWIRGLAQAIAALHTKLRHTRIVHADLQPRQVLLCGDDLRVGDFNRARVLERDHKGAYCSFTIPSSKGRWRAPEEFRKHAELDEKLDIYTVGLMIFAIFKREEPYKHLSRNGVREKMLANGYIALDIDPGWNEEIRSLIKDCTKAKQTERINALQLLARVEALEKKLSACLHNDNDPCPGGPSTPSRPPS